MTTINVGGKSMTVVICPDCGARLFPMAALADHRLRHDPAAEKKRQDAGTGQNWAVHRQGKTHKAGTKPRMKESDKKNPNVNIRQTLQGRRRTP